MDPLGILVWVSIPLHVRIRDPLGYEVGEHLEEHGDLVTRLVVETSRKLEHEYPHALKVKYKGSWH